VAEIVIAKMREYDESLFDLQAFCIMPNHVHVLFSMAPQVTGCNEFWPDDTPGDYVQLDEIMHRIKGGSAYLANRHLGRTGKFWFKDSYDHYVRNEQEWLKIAWYILQNPVKAGLAEKWELWPFNFCKPELLEYLLFRG
ncbi:MAG: hypothetical protein KA165_07490, partial [Saprospiraceae bacterium]|nr:hypothetical protein [Saprospiraceae bacterium]